MLLLFVPLTHAPPSHEYPIIHHTSVPSSITFPSVTRVFHHPSHLHPSHKYSIIHHIPIRHTSIPSSITFAPITQIFHHPSHSHPSHEYSIIHHTNIPSHEYSIIHHSCTHHIPIHHTIIPSSFTFAPIAQIFHHSSDEYSITQVFHHPSHLHPSHFHPSHKYSIIHHIPIHHTSVPSSITFPSISRVFHHISITQALPSHKYSYSRSHTNTSPIYAQEQFSCTHGNNPKIHPTHLITELPCRLLKPRVPCCCISPHSYGRHPERSSCGRQLLPG